MLNDRLLYFFIREDLNFNGYGFVVFEELDIYLLKIYFVGD